MIFCVNKPCDRQAVCNPLGRCAKNRTYQLPTLREEIAVGPTFVPVDGTCIACGSFREFEPDEVNKVDKSTGLGIKCWRSWRWSSVRERGPDVAINVNLDVAIKAAAE